MLTLLISILFAFDCTYAGSFYRTLLNGDKFKGFLQVSPVGNDQYVVSFNVTQIVSNARWGVYMASAPYDMALITENCRRTMKSPFLLRNLPLEDKTVSAYQIIGHTVVVTSGTETVACATVILPGSPLLRASFHVPPIEGHIHLIPFKDTVRILPDLKYSSEFDHEEPQKAIMLWDFVSTCEENITTFDDISGNELGVDSRTTLSIQVAENFTFHMFALYVDGMPFACAPITNVETRQVRRGLHVLSQAHYFEPVRSASDIIMGTLHIRDDCLDMATETIHESYEQFYPTVNIFGPETIALKSLVTQNSCGPLRPQFPRPAATAYYLHPVVGRLVLVDMDDRILLTGELRQIHEFGATRATVQVSSEWTDSTEKCPQCPDGDKCRTVEDAAVIVGKDEPTVTLSGVFPWFQITNARSIVVDLHWTKVCANVTYLGSGALSAHALIRQISTTSAPIVASIVVLEYPANNYTEALVNKHKVFSATTAHSMPVDMSITSSPPCGIKSLGSSKQKWWLKRLASILSGNDNDTTVIIGSKQLVTGPDSVLGVSILLKDEEVVSCGHFEPLSEKVVAVAKFEDVAVGYVKMTQHGTSNWAAGIPTEIYYSLDSVNDANFNDTNIEVEWQFVTHNDSSCSDAAVFDPFQTNNTSCSREEDFTCALGDAYSRSTPLILNTRQHLVVNNLPLSGPYALLKTSLRIRRIIENETAVECAVIRQFSEATFRWIAPSDLKLSQVQSIIVKKLDVDSFQVLVDYTRSPYKSKCSIYRITVLEEDWRLSEVLNMFSAERKKFKSDVDFDCGDDLSDERSQTSGSSTTSFFILFYAIFLYS